MATLAIAVIATATMLKLPSQCFQADTTWLNIAASGALAWLCIPLYALFTRYRQVYLCPDCVCPALLVHCLLRIGRLSKCNGRGLPNYR